MREHRDYLEGLLTLHMEKDAEARRSSFRQSMATLAAAVQSRPVPLEGFDREALRQSVRAALEWKLLDDLDFLSPAAASASLYELAGALPSGVEKRELGRRVVARLHEGNARTFVALATLLAQGSKRALAGARVRARLALAIDLPIGTGASADGLAFALVSRRDAEREWITLPSMGALSERRLTARTIERAAREAARRFSQGDASALKPFDSPQLRAAFARLLSDREPLVYRHVASARGLLSNALPRFAREIERDLDPRLSPTEWRRAATSLGASAALSPDAALNRVRSLLASPLVTRDTGVAAAVIPGLSRAFESEPEVADSILDLLVRAGGIEAVEALVALRHERFGVNFGESATKAALERVTSELAKAEGDDGRIALLESLREDLSTDRDRSLRGQIVDALIVYADEGAREAYGEAKRVLSRAESAMRELEGCGQDTTADRRRELQVLRELDVGLLAIATVGDLLTLGAASDDTSKVLAPLDDLLGRLHVFLTTREQACLRGVGPLDHATLRMRRLQTFLHLVDADGSYGDARNDRFVARRLSSARLFLSRARDDAPSPLRRIVCAAAIRACDGIVRDEVAEVSDVLTAIITHVTQPSDLVIVEEATMVPEIADAVRAYRTLHERVAARPAGGESMRRSLDALLELGTALPIATSPRVEALRVGIVRFARALEALAAATSLTEVVSTPSGSLLQALAEPTTSLARITSGAQRRIDPESRLTAPQVGASLRLFDFSVERSVRATHEVLDASPEAVLEALRESLRTELPVVFADLAIQVLDRIPSLPTDAPPASRPSFLPAATKEHPLPAWLPPNRVLGGFYVVRTLGAGAGGSVFVVRRAEDRHDDRGERFAMKVPDYDGAAARMLSEDEFLRLFREEAGALLAVPQHQNLAEFVTFDARAKPKPVLVMELVEGPTLTRLLEMGALGTPRALEVLDGIAAGLEAMHRVGVAHLDVKPGNVILREEIGSMRDSRPMLDVGTLSPVLVDFGLAGRKLRPGCATGEYGAPEIWGLVPQGVEVSPTAADVYAFGCLAYEVLTGRTLFEAPSEVALITQHVAHDGNPPGVEQLSDAADTAPFAELLNGALRRDPRNRASIGQLRKGLATLRPRLSAAHWPRPAQTSV